MLRTTIFSTCLALAPLLWGQAPPTPPAAPIPPAFNLQTGAYLGVGVIEVNEASAGRVGLPSPAGVEVAHVAEDSPAAQAGLEKGDVVTKFRGETVQGVEHFVRLVRETPVGREVELELASGEGRRSAKAVIGERKPAFALKARPEVSVRLWEPVEVDIPRPTMIVRSGSLGATLESISGDFAQVFGVSEGVLVREVEEGGSAAAAGMQAGDVITSIENNPVSRTSDVRLQFGGSTGETATVEVMRDKVRKTLEIRNDRKTFTRPFKGARQVSRQN